MKHPEIFLLRHGQTTWNRIGRHQGQLDSVLTLNGINQVRGVTQRLLREVIDWEIVAIASSPSYRCRQTAAILCDQANIDVGRILYDDRLLERCFGHWEGLSDYEIIKSYPEEWSARKKNPWSYSIPGGGENYQKLSDRVFNWLNEQNTNKPIIIVTHGQTGRALRGIILELLPIEILALPQPQTAAYRILNGKIFFLESECLKINTQK